MATKPNKIEPETNVPAADSAAVVETSEATPEATPEAAAPAAPAVGVAAVGAVKEGNVVKLASGERRVDYIKRRFKEGATRGTIAKELGVPYQIVFAATKKPKADATAAVAQTAAAAVASASAADPAPAA